MKRKLNRLVNLGLLVLGILSQLTLLLDTVRCEVSEWFPLWVGLLCLFIWFVVPMVLGFVANFMSRTMKKLHLGGLNSMLGATVGIFKYLLLLSAVVNVLDFCTRFVKLYSDEAKQESYLYYPVKSFISVIVPDNITSSENDAEPADGNNQQTVEKE